MPFGGTKKKGVGMYGAITLGPRQRLICAKKRLVFRAYEPTETGSE